MRGAQRARLLAARARERRGRAAADPARSAEEGEVGPGGRARSPSEDGAVTVQNPCLSGGAIEVFLEPVAARPARRSSSATRRSPARCCGSAPSSGSRCVRRGRPTAPSPGAGDLALVVAAHGRDELRALRRGLEAGLPYVGPRRQREARRRRDRRAARRRRRRGAARADRRARRHRDRRAHRRRRSRSRSSRRSSRCAARRRGRRGQPAQAPRPLAVDPICGMTVAAVAEHARRSSATARRSTSAARAARAEFEAQSEHVPAAG